MKSEFWQLFLEKYSNKNFMKISPMATELFYADRLTGGWSDLTKLTVAFRKFANAP